jgi:hypothetical protein
MSFIAEHGTKLYGGLTSFFGIVGGLVTTHAFDKLLTETQIGWLGIVCTVSTAVLGGMTAARGFNNSTAERVATAMETAIKFQPPGDPNAGK